MKIIDAREFGKMIRQARKQAGLTQMQLAAVTNSGDRFIRELEKGKATCQLEKALLVSQMLGIKLDAQLPTAE